MPSQQGDVPGLLEQKLRVVDRLGKVPALLGKDPHAIRHLGSGFGLFGQALREPNLNRIQHRCSWQVPRTQPLHLSEKPRSNIATNNSNTPAATDKPKAQSKQWSIVSANDSTVGFDEVSSWIETLCNSPTGFAPFHMWHAPMNSADYGFRASKADGQVRLLHGKALCKTCHSRLHGPPEAVYRLPRVTNNDDSLFSELVKHRMVSRGEVL